MLRRQRIAAPHKCILGIALNRGPCFSLTSTTLPLSSLIFTFFSPFFDSLIVEIVSFLLKKISRTKNTNGFSPHLKKEPLNASNSLLSFHNMVRCSQITLIIIMLSFSKFSVKMIIMRGLKRA